MTPSEKANLIRQFIREGRVESDSVVQAGLVALASTWRKTPVLRVVVYMRTGLAAIICEGGIPEPFSFLKAVGVNQPGQDPLAMIQKAARREVKDQTDKFRLVSRLSIPSGRRSPKHVGHVGAAEFRHLLTAFFQQEFGEDLSDLEKKVLVRRNHLHPEDVRFADRALADRWAEYHSGNAELEMQCPSENLRARKSPTLRKACRSIKV